MTFNVRSIILAMISHFERKTRALLPDTTDTFLPCTLHTRTTVEFNSVKMPFNVSDIMANYLEGENGDEDGFIVITGGCNSPKGNERVNFDGEDLFSCLSTSNKTLKFDPFANTFEELAEAPHERQRHAAVVMDGELYVLGGRDSNDDLVAAIDVRICYMLADVAVSFTCLSY